MSEENLEQLHRAYSEWARGDFRAGRVRMAPDVRCSWQTPEGPMEGQGPAEVERNFDPATGAAGRGLQCRGNV
jgi:hypothetical protein